MTRPRTETIQSPVQTVWPNGTRTRWERDVTYVDQWTTIRMADGTEMKVNMGRIILGTQRCITEPAA